jgi:hypothetical protein
MCSLYKEMAMPTYTLARMQHDADEIDGFFVWLRDKDLTERFVGMLSGHTKADIVQHVSAHGVEQIDPTKPPLPSLPLGGVEPVGNHEDYQEDDDYFIVPYIEYAGPAKIVGIDGENHCVMGRDGFPNYCVESGEGKYHKKWVPVSPGRDAGMRRGSSMMSSNGFIIPNPLWRAALMNNAPLPSAAQVNAVVQPSAYDRFMAAMNM